MQGIIFQKHEYTNKPNIMKFLFLLIHLLGIGCLQNLKEIKGYAGTEESWEAPSYQIMPSGLLVQF